VGVGFRALLMQLQHKTLIPSLSIVLHNSIRRLLIRRLVSSEVLVLS
jgi:hypothetical protein